MSSATRMIPLLIVKLASLDKSTFEYYRYLVAMQYVERLKNHFTWADGEFRTWRRELLSTLKKIRMDKKKEITTMNTNIPQIIEDFYKSKNIVPKKNLKIDEYPEIYETFGSDLKITLSEWTKKDIKKENARRQIIDWMVNEWKWHDYVKIRDISAKTVDKTAYQELWTKYFLSTWFIADEEN